jgi:hypothetical protein
MQKMYGVKCGMDRGRGFTNAASLIIINHAGEDFIRGL